MAMPGADDDVTINQANRGGTSTLNPMANTQPTTDITPPGPPATTTKAAPQQEPTPSATPADNTPTLATAATNGNEANAALPTAPVPPEPAPTAAARRGSLAPEANGGTDERRPSADSDEESDGKVRKLDYRKAALLEQQLKVGGNTMNTDDDTGGDVEDEKYRARGGPNNRFVCYHDELGSGAFKTVYKGMDVEVAVEVAWNEMKVQRLSEADKKRLDAEVALLQKLRHRHVVQFFGNWTVIKGGQEHRVFITELMTSGTLKQFLRDTGAPKHEVLQKWCKQILSALKYMHDKGIIHRDLKCDNIFIEGTTGEVKIGDLGLAMVYKEFGPKSSVIGTPEFMAPEVAGHDYSEKSDLWSLGVTLFVMVCGSKNLPFTSVDGDRFKIPHDIASTDPRDHRETLEAKFEQFGLSDNLRDLLHKLLTVDPNRRVSAKEALQHPWVHKINLKGTIVRATSPHETIETHNHFATFCEMTVLQRTALLAAATTLLEWPVINKLNSQFEALDEDQDGVLSFDEFRAGFLDEENDLLPNLTEDMLRAEFDAVDLDNTGCIKYSEFIAAQAATLAMDKQDAIEAIFHRLDLDDSGSISIEDLVLLLPTTMEISAMRKIIAQADMDGDGNIDLAEFTKIMSKHDVVSAHRAASIRMPALVCKSESLVPHDRVKSMPLVDVHPQTLCGRRTSTI
eukprot:m.46054 g.46054  ORF g.46054 m.46054 type:complete len:683 (+) comp8713_c0_seq1:757-2805(+)